MKPSIKKSLIVLLLGVTAVSGLLVKADIQAGLRKHAASEVTSKLAAEIQNNPNLSGENKAQLITKVHSLQILRQLAPKGDSSFGDILIVAAQTKSFLFLVGSLSFFAWLLFKHQPRTTASLQPK